MILVHPIFLIYCGNPLQNDLTGKGGLKVSFWYTSRPWKEASSQICTDHLPSKVVHLRWTITTLEARKSFFQSNNFCEVPFVQFPCCIFSLEIGFQFLNFSGVLWGNAFKGTLHIEQSPPMPPSCPLCQRWFNYYIQIERDRTIQHVFQISSDLLGKERELLFVVGGVGKIMTFVSTLLGTDTSAIKVCLQMIFLFFLGYTSSLKG